MSDRERVRRPDPARTHPLRNVAGVFRRADGVAVYPAGPAIPRAAAAPATGDAPAGPASATNPFAWTGDDPVSRAVRAGCDVVEQAVRRGFGVAGDPSSPSAGAGGLLQGPWTGLWTTGQWVDAMTGAFTTWAQWMDAWSSMVRAAMGGDAGPGPWSSAGSPASRSPTASSPSSSSSAPSPSPSSSGASSALHLTVELRTARAASVELDLSPGAATAFEVHGLLAPAAAAAPPITDVSLSVVDGGVQVTLGSIDQHPAGVYAGAVLAAGRACGTLTVRLT